MIPVVESLVFMHALDPSPGAFGPDLVPTADRSGHGVLADPQCEGNKEGADYAELSRLFTGEIPPCRLAEGEVGRRDGDRCGSNEPEPAPTAGFRHSGPPA